MIRTDNIILRGTPQATHDAVDEMAPGTPATIAHSEQQGAATDPGMTTRRTLLGAGLGALLATIATALGRPQAAQAIDYEAVYVGRDLTATVPTTIQNQVNNNDIIVAKSVGLGAGTGGGAAIHGDSESGRGVWGTSRGGHGVQGRSDSSLGVYGYSNTGNGVHGYSGAGDGVSGYTDGAGSGKAGLHGQANVTQEGFGLADLVNHGKSQDKVDFACVMLDSDTIAFSLSRLDPIR